MYKEWKTLGTNVYSKHICRDVQGKLNLSCNKIIFQNIKNDFPYSFITYFKTFDG